MCYIACFRTLFTGLSVESIPPYSSYHVREQFVSHERPGKAACKTNKIYIRKEAFNSSCLKVEGCHAQDYYYCA